MLLPPPGISPDISPDISPEILSDIMFKTGHFIRSMTTLMEGQSHKVYQITLGEDKYCLRIAKDEFARLSAQRGMEVLKHLKQAQPSLQAPHVIHESDSYTILQYLAGEPLRSWNTLRLSRDRRQLLLNGLAAFLFALWTCPIKALDDKVGGMTYCDWLRDEVDKGLRRSLQGTGWGDPIHFLHRRMTIHSHVPEKDDTATAPKHGDLNSWNVLVDASGFTGVIDWDTAQIVPIPAAVQHPMFIADIPGWRNDDVPNDMTFQEDREVLEQEVKRLAARSTSSTAQRIPELLPSSYERQFFELLLRNKRINDKYILLRSTQDVVDKARAANELESFLTTYPDLRSNPAVSKLQTQLSGFSAN